MTILENKILCKMDLAKINEEIVKQAEIVRNAQKAYFKNRTASNLELSKKQERALDALIVSRNVTLGKTIAPELFK